MSKPTIFTSTTASCHYSGYASRPSSGLGFLSTHPSFHPSSLLRKIKVLDIKNNRNVKETTKLTTDEKVKGGRTTIVGDSIILFIHGDKLSRKHNVKCMSFPGAKSNRTLIELVYGKRAQRHIKQIHLHLQLSVSLQL